MIIDWEHFTPLASLAGGLLIGLAAGLFALLNGRIAGISGIVGGLVERALGYQPWQDGAWRLCFAAGLLLAVPLWRLGGDLPVPTIVAGNGALIGAGLLVGIGTRYGSGCTSGHGVCGLARGSVRSLVATASFMAAGFMVVFLARHL